MRFFLCALLVLFGLARTARANTEDDLAFAKGLADFDQCYERAFSNKEFERLQALEKIDERETDWQKKQAAYYSQQALRCQQTYLKRAQREAAEQAAFKQRADALAASPDCHTAFETGENLDAISMLPKIADTMRLANAGETSTACQQMKDFVDQLKSARVSFMTCYKSLDGSVEGQAELKEAAISRATEANRLEQDLMTDTQTYGCSP